MSSKYQNYIFEKTYSYSVECPYEGAITDGIEDAKVIDGDVSFTADLEWNSDTGEYECEYTWIDQAGIFSDDGNPPDKEDDFYRDAREFLLSQGIEGSKIPWF